MAISISCSSCDKVLKVKNELAGKKVKCPGCGKPIVVDVDDESGGDAAEAARPRPPAREEDESEDRPRKRKRKKQKNNAMLLIGLAAGAGLLLLVLVIGAVLLFVLRGSGGKTSTEQAKRNPDARKDNNPKQEVEIPEKRPKGGIVRGMDVQKVKSNMHQIGLAYHNYVSTNRKGPTKAQDLMQFLERSAEIEKMLTDGSIVFIYNVSLMQMTQGSSNTLIAYEKDADTRGLRVVLYGDGSVDMLPEDEFQTKPKAQPK